MKTTSEQREELHKFASNELREVKRLMRSLGNEGTFEYQSQRILDLLSDFSDLEAALADARSQLVVALNAHADLEAALADETKRREEAEGFIEAVYKRDPECENIAQNYLKKYGLLAETGGNAEGA
jgi:hypothetical protein